MSAQSIFIVSIPRSGSTVLSNLLDAYEDVVCPPESFFPAVLDHLDESELKDKPRVAALFVVSCSDGSPLSLSEATDCIKPSKTATLEALGGAIARKQGRDPDTIRAIVWKFTRMVGCWKYAAGIGGKFLILHRNPLNVFESQFRVPFGEKNRDPLRFALFAASYDAAFSLYPSGQTLHLQYAHIPNKIPEILRWIGSSGKKRLPATGFLDEVAERSLWHSNINKPFEDRDAEKLKNLSFWQVQAFRAGHRLLGVTGFLPRIARQLADQRQMDSLRKQADCLLRDSS
jgi:hypothetical protein